MHTQTVHLQRPSRSFALWRACLPVLLTAMMALPVQAQHLITTFAGDGTAGFGGDNGLAPSAQLSGPTGLVFDSAGTLYVADQNNARIRKISPSGIISTFAGNGTEGYSGDGGPALDAQLNYPIGMAADSANNIYVSQYGNSVIRKINSGNTISTVAGGSGWGYNGDGIPATDAWLNYVQGLAVDGAGNLYIVDEVNHRVRKVDTSGVITTAVGNGVEGFSGDGGVATDAQLRYPARVVVDGAGNLYVADPGNNRVRKVSPSGTISTFAGNGSPGFSGDGGLATSAQLRYPYGLAVDGAGNLFIADLEDQRIRKVDTSGVISTVAGDGTTGFGGDGGAATSAQLNGPVDLAIRNTDLFISDAGNQRIRLVEGVAQAAVVTQAPALPVPMTSLYAQTVLALMLMSAALLMTVRQARRQLKRVR